MEACAITEKKNEDARYNNEIRTLHFIKTFENKNTYLQNSSIIKFNCIPKKHRVLISTSLDIFRSISDPNRIEFITPMTTLKKIT